MKNSLFALLLTAFSIPLFCNISESVLPMMDEIYVKDFGNKVNSAQKARIKSANEQHDVKLRVMTYNMLYNMDEAEKKLPRIHRWQHRLPRLKEYLLYAKPDLIGSQELQTSQVQEVIAFLGPEYSYYGEQTRENEGREDVNAIFFRNDRLELINAETIPFEDKYYKNGFTYCHFRDKEVNQEFIAINTKLTWGNADRRLAEAIQLNRFATQLPVSLPLVLLGDFNTFPFLQHNQNIFFDGEQVEQALKGKNLDDAKKLSTFGHFGPLCSINNSRKTLEPFVGPECTGFILDHILVNEWVEVFTHGIDTAKVDGEYPSDHFPLVADLIFKKSVSN